MWLARFRAACGLFYVIIAIVATGSGDDKAPTSTSSGQAIAAYAATHQAGAFAGLLISLEWGSSRSVRRQQSSNGRWSTAIQGCFPTGKLSTADWSQRAAQQLTRQVQHGHVLTLCDTTWWCSRRESNPEP
jgi:hypothetical protein